MIAVEGQRSADQNEQEAKDRLLKIDTNVNKLMDIVNMLLDISRIESGRTEMKLASIKIDTLTESVSDILMPQIKQKVLPPKLDRKSPKTTRRQT